MKRLLPLLVLAACSRGAAPPAAVEVADAVCRPALAGRDATSCSAALTASRDDRLVSLASPNARDIQAHEMSTEGGMMRMREMTEGLRLPAGQSVRLAPGGDHLMVIGATVPLTDGGVLPVTLTFENAPPQKVMFRIARPADIEGGSGQP